MAEPSGEHALEPRADWEYTKFESNIARDNAVFAILERYKDTPYVRRAISEYVVAPIQGNRPLDAWNRYFAEISQYRILTDEDEWKLFKTLDRGLALYRQPEIWAQPTPDQETELAAAAAAHEITYHTNLRIVASIANEFTARGSLQALDLMQEGNIGLAKAIRRFDKTTGNRFSTYAVRWIKQAIGSAVEDQGRTVRIPRYQNQNWRKITTASGELTQTLKRTPTASEVGTATGLSADLVTRIRQLGKLVAPDYYIELENETVAIGDAQPDPNGSDREMERLDILDAVIQYLLNSKLSTTEIAILSLRYGLWLEFLRDATVETPKGEVSYADLFDRIGPAGNLSVAETGAIFGMTDIRFRWDVEMPLMKKLRETQPKPE